MTIGQLAERSGVGVETVRFYERRGLLTRPPRPGSGFRAYPAEAVARIVFIRRAKELGFSLKEIKQLLALRVRSPASCGRVKQRAEAKLADIEAKLIDLRRIKKTLSKLVTDCEQREPTAECPVLDALEH